MALGQVQQRAGEAGQAGVQQGQRLARDQHHGAVDHVLAGAAPVDPGRRLLIEQRHRRGEFLHQRDRQAAGAAAGMHQRRDVVQLRLADAGDGARRALGNQALGRLGPRQAFLETEHGLHHGAVVEHGDHLRRRQEGVEDVHAAPPKSKNTVSPSPCMRMSQA
jgi:hypothetical protein